METMPFRMRVSGVSDEGTDLSVSGQLVEGSYMGPEAVSLCGLNGQWANAMVTHHAIEFPKDWPVVPDDGSTLILNIPKPHAGFILNRSQLVVGQGSVIRNHNRMDITGALTDPEFWAIWTPLHLYSEEFPEPSIAWGLSSEQADSECKKRFQSHWNSGVWPYVRFDLNDGGYVEMEYAAGIEHQNRVWIGVTDGPRVLLGYDSGHFSFPSLRIQEVLELASRMNGNLAAPLLLLPGAYLTSAEEFPFESARQWLKDSPGFREEFMDAALAELAKNVVSKLVWEFSDDCGWINNWQYGQRNPASPMSILGPEDFRFIRDFFRF